MEFEDFEFKIENLAGQGRVLLTDEGEAKITYIARVTDPSLFDSMFVDTLTAKLAVDLAYPVTNSTTLQAQMQRLFERKLSEARSLDSTEGTTDSIISTVFTDFRAP